MIRSAHAIPHPLLCALPCPILSPLVLPFLYMLLCLFPAYSATAAQVRLVDGIPHIVNPDQPEDGSRVLQLEELWRAGGDEDDVFFGVIREVLSDDSGLLYLLDQQLAQVWVYSPAGALLRTLSRQGEGPGEVHRPADCFFLPDRSIGILDRTPGTITRVDLKGTPLSSLRIRRPDETAAGSMRARSGLWRGGTFVLCGQEQREEDGELQRVGFLSVFSEDGVEQARLWNHAGQAWDFRARSYAEKHAYFVEDGRAWDIGPDGFIYVARERDRYAVHVYNSDGTLVRIIERDFEPVKRSDEEKRRIASGLTMTISGEVVQLDSEILDTEPCLQRLHVDEEGRLWVWHARSRLDQPEGVFEACDLFSPEGAYLAQIRLAVDAEPGRDLLVPLAGGRFVLLRGIVDAMQAMWGGGAEDPAAGEVVPLEVVCLQAGRPLEVGD